MTRIATIPLQRTLSGAVQQAQRRLADTQLQLNSGKKAKDLAALGGAAVRTLSARTALATQAAQSAATSRLGTTLSLYEVNITAIDTVASDLKTQLMAAVGTGSTATLPGAIDSAFSQIRSALNATDGFEPLFGGAQGDEIPFKPAMLADTIGVTPESAFGNDDVRAAAPVGGGATLTYGITARDLGSGLLAAFQTLAAAGPIGDTPTAAQRDALNSAIGQIDAALPQVRGLNASNGLRQTQMATLASRADDRAALLQKLVSDNEDADYGEISMALTQQKTMLEASYAVFGQVSSLSLVNYLR
jgi:flagellar hook-associated protein 3 FlgL